MPSSLSWILRQKGFQVIEARRPNDVLRQDVASIAERAAKVGSRQ